MQPSNMLLVILFGALLSRPSFAQEGTMGENVEYGGVKFLSVHWVLSVADRGKTVTLEDGSVWQICPYCTQAASRLWPGAQVAIEDRGTTRTYRYRISVLADGKRSYPINAACVMDGAGMGQFPPPTQAARIP